MIFPPCILLFHIQNRKIKSLSSPLFFFKDGKRRYKYLVLGRDKPYFVIYHSDSYKKNAEYAIFGMLDFLIDNIFVIFRGPVFQQTVDIPMGSNCSPLLADVYLYSYEADSIQSLLQRKEKLAQSIFNEFPIRSLIVPLYR